MVDEVARYVPGYRLKNPPVVETGPFFTRWDSSRRLPGGGGAGDYLPTYAGNLDIMTAAAMRVGEAVANAKSKVPA